MCAYNTFDLSFLDPANVNNGGGGGVCEGELAVGDEVLDGNCLVGGHVGSFFEFPQRGIGAVDHVPLHTNKDVKHDFPLKQKHPQVPSLLAKDSVEDSGERNFKSDIAEKGLHSLQDSLVEFRNCLDGEDAGTSHVLPDMPLWKTIEDVSAPEMPINVGLEDKGQNGEGDLPNPEDADGNERSASGFEDRQVHGEVDRSAAMSGGDYADISDSLLNLTNEDEPLFMEVDGKDTMDEAYNVDANPLLTTPKDDVHEDVVPGACQPQTLDSNARDVVPGDVSTAEIGTASSLFHSGDGNACGDVHTPEMGIASNLFHSGDADVVSGDVCTAEMGTNSHLFPSGDGDQPKSAENPLISSCQPVENTLSPELLDEMMDCTLNSEDPEIPCNDDIYPFMYDYPVAQSRYTKASDLTSLSINQNYNDQESRSLKKEESPAHSFPAFQKSVPKINANHPIVSCVVKRELSDGNCLVPVSKHDNSVPADPSPGRSAFGAPKSTANQVLKEEVLNVRFLSNK